MRIDDANADRAVISAYGGVGKTFTTTNLSAATPTWTDITAVQFGEPLALSGDEIYLSNTGVIAYSSDFGATFDNRKGNITGSPFFVAVVGG